MSSIAVIHAARDEPLSDKIAKALLLEGHAVRRAENGAGTDEITKGNPAIVIWSGAALDEADMLERAGAALEQDALIPVAIGGASAPAGFERLQPIDLTGWGGDVADPRWRFVVDEISRAAQGDLLRDCEIWPEPADGLKLAAPASRSHGLHAGEEFPEPPRPPDDGVIQGELFAQSDEDGAPFYGAQNRQAHAISGFSPAHVLLGGGALLLAAAFGAVFIAPLFLTRPVQEAQQPSAAVTVADAREPHIAFVQPLASAPQTQSGPQTQATAPPEAQSGADSAAEAESDADAGLASVFDAENSAPGGGNSLQAEDIAGVIAPGPPPAGAQIEAEEIDALERDPEPARAPTEPETQPGAELDVEPGAGAPGPDLPNAQLDALVAAVALDRDAGVAIDHAAFEETYFGHYFRDCLECPDMAALPAGDFLMGAPDSEKARLPSESPQRRVALPRGVAMATREVTFKQWDACVADGGCRAYHPAAAWGRGDQPVVNVSFEDAKSYAAWLSRKTGWTYRLPSEAEWEYAARAGAATAFSFGEGVTAAMANFNGELGSNSAAGGNRGRPLPTASFAPNPFGLFDMHGNVWEWVADCWSPDHSGAPDDASARLGDCSVHVLKGGAFNTGGWRLRAAHRIKKPASAREPDNGFRVARDLF